MKKLVVLAPVLFAVSPALALVSGNLTKASPAVGITPIAVLTCAAVALALPVAWLLRSGQKGALVLSFFWMLFFSYGHVLDAIGGLGGGREVWLLLAWLGLMGFVAVVVARRRKPLDRILKILIVAGLAMLATPLAMIAWRLGARATFAWSPEDGMAFELPASPPDIYYIILDGHARADVLQDYYGYDDSWFVAELARRGFYVAGGSQANYLQTHLSLASSLNYTYLDEAAAEVGPASTDRGPLREMIRHNRAAWALRSLGYRYVTLSTGYLNAELGEGDTCLTSAWSPDEFQCDLLYSSLLSAFQDPLYGAFRQRILAAFQQLPEARRAQEPVFVMAHILAPHHPFVFGANGESFRPERKLSLADDLYFMANPDKRGEYRESYRNQVAYTDRLAIQAIDAILKASPEEPIIILQADHGPGLDWGTPGIADRRERASILNAYYLPQGGEADVYDTITPVNTFRVVLNRYLGASYPLLKDETYFATWNEPYRYERVEPSAGSGPS